MKPLTSMGLGKLVNFDTIFPSKFRYILECEEYSDLRYSIKEVHVYYKPKIIKIKAFEFLTQEQDSELNRWVTDVISERAPINVVLTSLDGCGYAIYKLDINQIEIKRHRLIFEYGTSGLVEHTMKMTYKELKRTFLYNEKEKTT